jgi:hypothetical protein
VALGVGGALPGPNSRAALTGRASSLVAYPGLHPGLVELALQAGIAVGVDRAFRGEPRGHWGAAWHDFVAVPSRGVGGSLPGSRLRAALTGRASSLVAYPGLHPGLMELALQAGIAVGWTALSGVNSEGFGRSLA